MFLQTYISGPGTPPAKWYEKNTLWGSFGIFVALTLGGTVFGMNQGHHPYLAILLLLMAWPFGEIGLWALVCGLTRNKRFRIVAMTFGTLALCLLIWRGQILVWRGY
jgi:hypothetical protein